MGTEKGSPVRRIMVWHQRRLGICEADTSAASHDTRAASGSCDTSHTREGTGRDFEREERLTQGNGQM